jgi:hypothetical protein
MNVKYTERSVPDCAVLPNQLVEANFVYCSVFTVP